MKRKAIYPTLLLILATNITCQNIDDSEEIEAITKVIIAEGEAI